MHFFANALKGKKCFECHKNQTKVEGGKEEKQIDEKENIVNILACLLVDGNSLSKFIETQKNNWDGNESRPPQLTSSRNFHLNVLISF